MFQITTSDIAFNVIIVFALIVQTVIAGLFINLCGPLIGMIAFAIFGFLEVLAIMVAAESIESLTKTNFWWRFIKLKNHGRTSSDPVKLSNMPVGEYQIEEILSDGVIRLLGVNNYDLRYLVRFKFFGKFPSEIISDMFHGATFVKDSSGNFHEKLVDEIGFNFKMKSLK